MIISKSFDVSCNMLLKEFFDLKDKMIDGVPMEIKSMWELKLDLEEYRTIKEEDTEIKYGFKIKDKEEFYYEELFLKIKDKLI